jgi:hypothetical protein
MTGVDLPGPVCCRRAPERVTRGGSHGKRAGYVPKRDPRDLNVLIAAVKGVGWAARRGPVFILDEPGPFPGSLPPNPACGFYRTGLSGDLCRVRDGVRVDPVVACCADDEGLAPHFCHECGPRGLVRSWFPERFEAGDLVDCHRGAGLAEFAFPRAEPFYQFLARVGVRAGHGVADDRPPVLPQDDPAESRYQVLLALAVSPGLEAGPRPVPKKVAATYMVSSELTLTGTLYR